MVCQNCGTDNNNGAMFCNNCGTRLESEHGVGDRSGQQTTSKTKKKRSKKGILFGIGIVLVALIIISYIVVNAKPTINLDKYLTVETTGYDGYGKAIARMDWRSILEDYGSKLTIGSAAKSKYSFFYGRVTPLDVLEDCIRVNLSSNANLSNGDEVSYSWSIDSNLSEYVNCKVKYSAGSIKVEGLEEVDTFDVFSDLSIEFNDVSPFGKIDMQYTGTKFDTYDFVCDTKEGLKNGDEVTIRFKEVDIPSFINMYGGVPATYEKKYTVSGLKEYVEKPEDLSNDFVNKLKEEAKDTIYSYLKTTKFRNGSTLSSLEYAGYIIDYAKNGIRYLNAYNDIYVIYHGVMTDTKGKFPGLDVYFPVRFTEVIKENDDFVYINRGITGSRVLVRKLEYDSIKGFLDPVSCYLTLVEGNSQNFAAECSDGFEKYAKYELISKRADVSNEYLDKLKDDATAIVKEYMAGNYYRYSTSELSYVGDYFLTAKNKEEKFEANNRLIVVLSATVSISNNSFAPTTVYFPVDFEGNVKISSSEYVYTEEYGLLGKRQRFGDSYYDTSGYVDEKKMFSEVVSSYSDKYTYEVTGGLATFDN